MQQMGHTDPKLALRIYAQAMRRGDDEKASLKALVEGAQWATIGLNDLRASERAKPRQRKNPAVAGLPPMGAAGIEPATSRV
jgi:hypothetical protein